MNRRIVARSVIIFLLGLGCSGCGKGPSEEEAKPEPYLYQQWYLEHNGSFYLENGIDPQAHIHAGEVLHRYSGRGVRIAVMDTYIDRTHEDLQGAVAEVYPDGAKPPEDRPGFERYHGTAVTGVIGARKNGKGILGIAYRSEIGFFQLDEDMSDSALIDLFYQAEAWGADIVNCSWGTGNVSEAVRQVIVDLAKNGRDGKGMIIVFASGNGGMEMGNDESSIEEVISVGSTDEENLRAWYSNYGPHLDLLAPGGSRYGITTLDLSGEEGEGREDEDYILYDEWEPFRGTSASAPIVSACIALILEKNPSLTRKEIEKYLHESSDKIGYVEYVGGRNDYYGYGKINLKRLLDRIPPLKE